VGKSSIFSSFIKSDTNCYGTIILQTSKYIFIFKITEYYSKKL